VLLAARLRRGDKDAVRPLQRMYRATAGAGHINDKLAGGWDAVEHGREFRRRNIWTRQVDLIVNAVESAVADQHHDERILRAGLCSEALKDGAHFGLRRRGAKQRLHGKIGSTSLQRL